MSRAAKPQQPELPVMAEQRRAEARERARLEAERRRRQSERDRETRAARERAAAALAAEELTLVQRAPLRALAVDGTVDEIVAVVLAGRSP